MSDQPRYYQPLEVPAFCFIWEAVMWVSFGRFPEGAGYQDFDELKEDLGVLSFAWKDSFGGARYRFRGVYWFESEMAGVDITTVDWERYENALRTGYERIDSVQQYVDDLTRHSAIDQFPGDPRLAEERYNLYRASIEKKLADLPFVDDVHKRYQQQIDRGWSRLFQALVEGTLKGYGWGDLTQEEIRERASQGRLNDLGSDDSKVFNPWHSKIPAANTMGPLIPMGECMEIPQKEWSLSGIAPDGRYVTSDGRNWWDVCFPSDQLFTLFPRPLSSNVVESDKIEIVNPGLAIGGIGNTMIQSAPYAPSSRGRKKLANGEIERACQQLYGRRLASGEKELALAEEAAHFAMEVWGQNLSRSTFQEYMRPFRTRGLPENMPENHAGK